MCACVCMSLCTHDVSKTNQFLCTVCFLEIRCWHAHRQPNTPYTYTNIHVLSVQQFTVLYVYVNNVHAVVDYRVEADISQCESTSHSFLINEKHH